MHFKKYFVLVSTLLFSLLIVACSGVGQISSGSENVTVRVVGVGSTYEEAKKNGFRNAVMEAYGALVISERRLKNDTLSEDELSYSSGMVEKFNVIDYYISQQDRLFHLNMQVQVSSSKLKTRFVYSTDSRMVDGQSLGKKILEGRTQANSELER